MRTLISKLAGVALCLAVLLVAASCGDDDDDTNGSEAPGNVPRPTGEPIDLGFISMENSPAGSYPTARQGAVAAAEYINNELGGVNGRPINIEACISNASPESSRACANKFVQSGKVAVLSGIDYGADGSVAVLSAAELPYIAVAPISPTELTAPTAVSFVGGSLGQYGGMAIYIGRDIKAKKVRAVMADVPAARTAVDMFIRPLLSQNGVTDFEPIYENPAAADFTPALTRATDGNPDAVIIAQGPPACGRIMQATDGLGLPSEKFFYPSICASNDSLETGGSGAQNSYFVTEYVLPGSDDPEVETFSNAMKKYQNEAPIDPATQGGFTMMMNLYNQLGNLQGEITPAAILSTLKAATNEPNFMSAPYTCSSPQVPGLTAICNANIRIIQYTGSSFEDVGGGYVDTAAAIRSLTGG